MYFLYISPSVSNDNTIGYIQKKKSKFELFLSISRSWTSINHTVTVKFSKITTAFIDDFHIEKICVISLFKCKTHLYLNIIKSFKAFIYSTTIIINTILRLRYTTTPVRGRHSLCFYSKERPINS